MNPITCENTHVQIYTVHGYIYPCTLAHLQVRVYIYIYMHIYTRIYIYTRTCKWAQK